MKRFFFGLGATLFLLLGSGVPFAHAANTDNFTIRSFDADYFLDKDTEGRSTLKTVEKITAIFPDYNQNHGIERALPLSYDGHSTHLKIESVTDASGAKLNYSDSTSNDNRVLRIGDADTYVHGTQAYVVTYTQRDTTKFFSDTNDDEFYWDVNGTQWAQPMSSVTARVHVAPSITSKLNDKASCYQGVEGSTTACAISRSNSDGALFSAHTDNLNSYENMTLAIGFQPHTFVPYQPTAGEKIANFLFSAWVIVLIFGSVGAVALIVFLSIRYTKIMGRVKGLGTVVVEYLPPKDASVLLSGIVMNNATSDITAQLIDLAVRHYLKIYQTKDKTLFKPAEYEIEIAKDTSDLRVEELRLLTDLFGKKSLSVGDRFAMKSLQNNYTLARKLLSSRKQLQTEAREGLGVYERAEKEAKWFSKIGTITVIIGILTLSPVIIIAAIIAFVFASLLWPRTEKGMALHDYLLGLREYISIAETDRIKMLQSPDGAEKVGVAVDAEDPKQLVKLYERVLPYAVLFGIEKEWTKQLGAYYEAGNTQPDWYSGNAAFNAVIFSSALSNFSSQSSSYSSSSSSSSGGSSGGGSSGGGGGGGGGGGW
jgi:uncharacterized membrane protein YgcG